MENTPLAVRPVLGPDHTIMHLNDSLTNGQAESKAIDFPCETCVYTMKTIKDTFEMLVCDNGVGIPDEHLERIFDRFHRVDTRLTREVNGLGLGLTICKRIVEMHDGIIWAENRQNGKGSVFYVRLPIDEIPGM